VGRLVAIALAVAVAGIVVVIVNGPGKDRLEPPAAHARQASTTSQAAAGTSEQAAAIAKPAATVRMRRLLFVTPNVTVPAGRAVRFVNADDVAHTVAEDLGARSGVAALFESARIAPGASFSYVPRTVGVIRYVCTLHPTVMHGRITVTAA
jgi:plastocyanin